MTDSRRIAIAPPARSHHIDRGGRRVGWSEWGRDDAAPVLFVTGAALTSALGFGADVVDDLGVRLLCVDRAGLGRSDPDPDKTFASVADDIGAVLTELGITAPPAVAFSQGAPFAVELAGRGLVSALAMVSAQDELVFPATHKLLHADVAHLAGAALADRVEFEEWFATFADAAGVWTLIVDSSADVDRAVYAAPGFADAFRAALAHGFAHGNAGYVRDLTLALGRWSTQPESVTIPVSLWYGRLDTSTVHSPDFGAILERRFPRCTRHVLDDEGGSLLWTRSREILEDLLRQ